MTPWSIGWRSEVVFGGKIIIITTIIIIIIVIIIIIIIVVVYRGLQIRLIEPAHPS